MSKQTEEEQFKEIGHNYGGMQFYDPKDIYIYRFIVRNFVKELPKKWGSFVRTAPGFLATDLSRYSTLNISTIRLLPVKSLEVYSNNSGAIIWNKTVMTDDRSWLFDFVIRPRVDENAWASIDEYKEHLTNSLLEWSGYRPIVDLFGVVKLPWEPGLWASDSEEVAEARYKHVYNFWNRRNPVVEVNACTDAEKAGGQIKCPQVKLTEYGASGWSKGFLGEDGLGLTYGFSTHIEKLKAINILPTTKEERTEIITTKKEKEKAKKNQNWIMLVSAGLGFYIFNKLYGDE
jgi:hypothetical protein